MEEEDTYGFGSFSELFDAGASSQKQKRLDLGALSRFCMSERLLSRFQQQQRRDKRCVMFQHVAAKFDGVGIDGGLGALGVAALEGGGVVWLQTAQSDSDALERRKKELRDITNRAPQETKSAAALFVALTHVASVQPTTVQNTVQGVELKLTDGNRLELTFMPGPFAGAAHRDEFLQALKKCMAVAAASTSSASARTSATTSCGELEAVKSGSGEPKAAAASETTGAAQKEEFRQLVRRYINVDPLSEEGVEIAKQVHAGTGYLLGPTMKQPPKFSADAEYRKKTVSELAEFLKRMNKEWSDADAHRELHTKAKHSRNEDGLFEYTDTVTGVQIPPRVYEERYLE
ncbi:Zinc finger, RING-type [Phytophthora cinnamomi]|uniref:Zinc finger, RING-type n=1 Tax=Phytophthora cinnamomi TaxID=4785 RepID=UPI00355A740B|nr:Zinc finger, RING-type [Phytophthora cinnamomi]